MKLLPLFLLLLPSLISYSQQEKFHMEARIIDADSNPVSDAYILNFRDLDKAVSRPNGIFDIWVLPGDSLVISHISYYRKTVTVHSLLLNPVIQLDLDTVNILEINIFSNPVSDYENAKKNIEAIDFNYRPLTSDGYTEQEMVQDMFNRENKVMRSEATSLKIATFSPSEIVGRIAEKVKRRKRSNQYPSKKR